jgi:hypothetical protein
MQFASLIVAICAAFISALSAIIAWLGTHPRPKLSGNITVATLMGTQGDFQGTAVLIHCMITNEVSEPVYAISYSLEINYDGQWRKLHRPVNFNMPTLYVGNGTWEVEMTPQCFIDLIPQKIEFGSPLMGFLVYFSEEPLVAEKVRLYRLTVTDVFSRQHSFTVDAEKLRQFEEMRMMDQPGIRTIDIFRLAGAIIRDTKHAPAEQPPAQVAAPAEDK